MPTKQPAKRSAKRRPRAGGHTTTSINFENDVLEAARKACIAEHRPSLANLVNVKLREALKVLKPAP